MSRSKYLGAALLCLGPKHLAILHNVSSVTARQRTARGDYGQPLDLPGIRGLVVSREDYESRFGPLTPAQLEAISRPIHIKRKYLKKISVLQAQRLIARRDDAWRAWLRSSGSHPSKLEGPPVEPLNSIKEI